MISVIDLLKLPSMKEGYIAAGGSGIYHVIRRFEILEETYPSVVRFLDEGTFYVTSFWNLADDKESRVHLIEAMIEHGCAGIGIMPGGYLNNEIDREILQLGNEYDFPIFYIPLSVRWGDLVAEYSVISNNNIEAMERRWLELALGIFVDFHLKNDPGVLCERMSKTLRLPIVISAVTVYSYGTEGINVAVLTSRIQNIRQSGGKAMQSPMIIRADMSRIAVLYFGEHSMIACCPAREEVQDNILQLYHQMAPFAVRELDNMVSHSKKIRKIEVNAPYYGNARVYIAVLRFENYEKTKHAIDKKYILYESNPYQKYCILLIPEEEDGNTCSIYEAYCKMIEARQPDLFIFSQGKYRQKNLQREVSRIKNLIHSLLFLKGCYSTDELSLIYMMSSAPRAQDAFVYSAQQLQAKPSAEVKTFLHTLRLYLVLHSIKDVSLLMGIHVNSVKYRMEKAMKFLEMDSDLPLSEIASLNVLMHVERMAAEIR